MSFSILNSQNTEKEKKSKDKEKEPKKIKGKDKEKLDLPNSSELSSKKSLVFKEVIVPSTKPKKEKANGHNERWTIWVEVGDFDAIPVEVDSSLTVHEIKKVFVEVEDLDLGGIKVQRLRLAIGDKLMDPQRPLAEQAENGERIKALLPEAAVNNLSSLDSNGSLNSQNSTKTNHDDASEVNSLRKEIEDLKRQMAAMRNHLAVGTFAMDFPSTSSNGSSRGTVSGGSIEAAVKKSNAEVLSHLKDLEATVNTRTAGLDEAMKQLVSINNSLKRIGGIMAPPLETTAAYLRLKDTLAGHEGPVEALARGDQLLFSGASDQTVKIWDLKTLRAKTLNGHTDNVLAVAATPDDKNVISGSDDRTIKIWDVESLQVEKSLQDDNTPCCLRVAHGHIFSGSFKVVKLWSLKKQKLVHTLPNHNHWVRSLAIGGGFLFTGGHNQIKVFDMGSFVLARTLQQNCGSIYGLVISGNMLYAATYENTVLVWDLRTYENVRSLVGHQGAVYALCTGQNDDTKLFSGAGSYSDNSIRVWDLRTNKCIQRCDGHSSSVNSLVMIDDKVYSGSTDTTVKSWKVVSSPDQ